MLPLEELIKDCATGTNPAAWEEFVRVFQPVIASTVIKTIRSSATNSPERTDDLIQETYLRILSTGTLKKFRSNEPKSIFGLVQAVAYTVALDNCRKEGAIKRGGKTQTLHLEEIGQVRANSDSSTIECNLLFWEIESVLIEITPFPRDRLIFLLHYRDGLSAKEIAGVPGISLGKKGVESLINRVLKELRRRILVSVSEEARAGGKLTTREGHHPVNSS